MNNHDCDELLENDEEICDWYREEMEQAGLDDSEIWDGFDY